MTDNRAHDTWWALLSLLPVEHKEAQKCKSSLSGLRVVYRFYSIANGQELNASLHSLGRPLFSVTSLAHLYQPDLVSVVWASTVRTVIQHISAVSVACALAMLLAVMHMFMRARTLSGAVHRF